MRVFLALKCAALQDSKIDELVISAGLSAPHWAQDRHLTLRFFGEVDENESLKLARNLDDLVADIKPLAVFWHPSRMADFPQNNPKVWAWQGEMTPSLIKLDSMLGQIETISAYSQEYAFHPHVTLAYLSKPTGVEVILNEELHLDQLVLLRSYTQQERLKHGELANWALPRYEVLNEWRLIF